MSHSKIRTDKTCLNCGSEVTGRYCSACGQENIEPKQTVWHLIQHFFSDITHFDGKFFETVKDLFAKPGFLSKEYMLGKRVSYLDPIRMYIFTSAFFFLIFFYMFDLKKLNVGSDMKEEIRNDPDLRALISKAKTSSDSLNILRLYNGTKNIPSARITVDTSQHKSRAYTKLVEDYSTLAEYDSVQKSLPASARDGWLKTRIETRKLVIGERYKKEGSSLIREMLDNFMHEFPKALFISLPAFALILKLLYIRRKQFYYVDHGIFSIHLYIYSFLVLLVFSVLNELKSKTGWGAIDLLIFAVMVYPFIYYFKAMRRFYGQSRGKTFLKYILLLILSLIIQLLIFTGFVLFTLFEA